MFTHIYKFSSKPALILDDCTEISYSKLFAELDPLARAVGTRSLVMNLCNNTFETVCGYLGFVKGGAVQLLLNEKTEAGTLRALIDTYRPSFIFLPMERTDLSVKGHEICRVGENVLLKLDDSVSYALHDELNLLLPTSGSTGNPKMVRLSYRNLSSNADSIAEYLSIHQNDRPITTMPMSYSYGLSIVNSHLIKGASLVLSRSSLAEAGFWKTLKETCVTTFGGVPYTYEILSKLRLKNIDLPHLRYFTQAGGRLSLKRTEEFVDFASHYGKKFIVMYGQTEATARMSYLPWEAAKSKIGSIGVAVPGGQFHLEGEDGKIIDEPENIGELVFQGKNVSLGYAESYLDLALGDENGGILRTGDLAKRDKDGFYYIVGRKKRFLKLFGNRVNLADVEEIAREAGFDAACGGKDDLMEVFVEDPSAIAVVPAFLSKRTGLHASAFKVRVVKKIPRNEIGKILYSELEKADLR